MPFIPKLIASGRISPAVGRFMEIGVYSVLAAVLAYAADSLTAGTVPELKTVGAVALTALLAYLGKSTRDMAKEASNLAK